MMTSARSYCHVVDEDISMMIERTTFSAAGCTHKQVLYAGNPSGDRLGNVLTHLSTRLSSPRILLLAVASPGFGARGARNQESNFY